MLCQLEQQQPVHLPVRGCLVDECYVSSDLTCCAAASCLFVFLVVQRIYGTAWESAAQLASYQALKAEAARRDHRKLGAELDLFSIQESAGEGFGGGVCVAGVVRGCAGGGGAGLLLYSLHMQTVAVLCITFRRPPGTW